MRNLYFWRMKILAFLTKLGTLVNGRLYCHPIGLCDGGSSHKTRVKYGLLLLLGDKDPFTCSS